MSDRNGTSPGIHVVSVDVENFHRLRAANARLHPGSGLVRVTGKNGAGKTSLLRAIRAALGGAAEVLPSAIHDEAEDGAVTRLELSNGFTITRRFTALAPKGYLKVVGPDGGEHKQGRLNEWLGSGHDFDVLAFFDLAPDRQRDVLLGLGNDPTLHTQLEALRARHAELYSERTPHISEQRRTRAVEKPAGDRPAPIDVSAELQRMGELQAAQRVREDAAKAVGVADSELEQNERDQRAAATEIERLEAELEAARTRALGLAQDREAMLKKRSDLGAEYLALPDPADEMRAVQERMEAADAVRDALEPWKEWDRAQDAFAKATDEVARLTDEMNRMKSTEEQLIAEAGIPIEGLTFDAETAEPLLNGRPLVVASGGERIRLAVAVAVAANPDLRIVLVDEANDLDLDALEALDELAHEHGFQVWVCRIGLEGAGEIVVEDGEARSADEPAGAPA